jgi:hypothetical protein
MKHVEDFNKCVIYKYIRILCIKFEINQGYTTMHDQPIIKICLDIVDGDSKPVRNVGKYL